MIGPVSYPSSFTLEVQFEKVQTPSLEVIAAAYVTTERWRVQETLRRLRRLHDENARLKFALTCARNTCQYALERCT